MPDTFLLLAPSLSISGKDRKSYCRKSIELPIVYVWKRKNETLYVGISIIGFNRPFGNHHHVIDRLDKVFDSDIFEIYYTSEPRALEEYLIKVNHSKYNVSHNGRNASYRVSYLRKKLEKSEKDRAKRDWIEKKRADAPRMILLMEAKKRVLAKIAEMKQVSV